MVEKRNDLFGEINRRGYTGSAVEIGVAEGGYSFYLLDNCPKIIAIYQVDPWSALGTDEYNDLNNTGQEEQDRRYDLVLNTALKYHGRAIPVRKFSAMAAMSFRDNFFCFVYIDANHKYDFIKMDLELWYPKCASGGIFAGHDYLDGVIASGD